MENDNNICIENSKPNPQNIILTSFSNLPVDDSKPCEDLVADVQLIPSKPMKYLNCTSSKKYVSVYFYTLFHILL